MSETGWIGSWSPGIGDPTVIGWITCAAYLYTAWRCQRVARRMSKAKSARAERMLWGALAVAFLLLGINKQLDLQTALAELGRSAARRQGWYGERRLVQKEFVLLVGAVGLVSIGVGLAVARKASGAARVAMVGAAAVACFVVTRAAAFNSMAGFLHSEWLGVRMNAVLELGGILVVLAGAWLRRS